MYMESILDKGIPRMCAECSSFVYHNMLCIETYRYIDRNEFLHKRGPECPLDHPPKRRELGRWIPTHPWSTGCGMSESYGFFYKCDKCGRQYKGGYNSCSFNFCPNCGDQKEKEIKNEI